MLAIDAAQCVVIEIAHFPNYGSARGRKTATTFLQIKVYSKRTATRWCSPLFLWVSCVVFGLFGFGGFEDGACGLEDWEVAFGRDVDHGLVVEVGLLTHP